MPKIKRKTNAETKPLYKKLSKEEQVREEEEKDESMLGTIEEGLVELGLTPFDNENVENDYLILPADITEENSKELGKYFNAFTQQKMWTRTIIGRLSTTVREMKRSVDDIKADVFANQPPKMPLKEKELRFQTDKRSRGILDDMFIYEEKLKMSMDYLDNLVDALTLVSREISRRGQDWELNQREENIGKKRGGGR